MEVFIKTPATIASLGINANLNMGVYSITALNAYHDHIAEVTGAHNVVLGSPLSIPGMVVSASVSPQIKADDAEVNTASLTYVLMKSLVIPSYLFGNTNALDVYFELKRYTNVNNAYGRIYVNGVAVGTEQVTGSASYVAFNETISNLKGLDSIQIYCKSQFDGAGYATYLRNFRLRGALAAAVYGASTW